VVVQLSPDCRAPRGHRVPSSFGPMTRSHGPVEQRQGMGAEMCNEMACARVACLSLQSSGMYANLLWYVRHVHTNHNGDSYK
jgi:hypothetical protein